MFYIRLFLWGLVAAMTLQGWLHADEYGTAATLVGGVTMTMSVWSESFVASVKGFMSSQPSLVALPRALVAAALQESTRHPIIKTLPRLKSTLEEHQIVWNAFRDAHVTWSLDHMDLIGGLQTEGAYVWNFWSDKRRATEVALNATKKDRCLMKTVTQACVAIEERIRSLEAQATSEIAAEAAWASVLGFHDASSSRTAERWWNATQTGAPISDIDVDFHFDFDFFQSQLITLHAVSSITDDRVQRILAMIPSFPSSDSWISRLLASLLEGNLWAAMMEHVRARESRVRELMIAAGIQELWAVHERILASSLKTLGDGANRKIVEDWFGEMASYAWWLPEEVPGIVRRCIGQEGGDCGRIGPTEIQALLVQQREQNRILEDWTRRIFIGMWNAMPIIGILFLLEMIVLIIPQRRVVTLVQQPSDDMRPLPRIQPRKTIRFLKS